MSQVTRAQLKTTRWARSVWGTETGGGCFVSSVFLSLEMGSQAAPLKQSKRKTDDCWTADVT